MLERELSVEGKIEIPKSDKNRQNELGRRSLHVQDISFRYAS
jgi:hypothetical protein